MPPAGGPRPVAWSGAGGFRGRAVRPSRDRLEGMRLEALERRIELDLAAGLHPALIGELGVLVQENPLQERLRGQLMLALYRSGRQADALRAYHDGRRLLVEQFGLEPSPLLSEMQQAILRQDPSLDLPASPTPAETRTAHLTGFRRSEGRQRAPRATNRRTPAPATAFVGRARQLAELHDLLLRSETRLLTLTGPAGIGKTWLALEVATRVSSAFADGAAVVDLTRVTHPDLVAQPPAPRSACAPPGRRTPQRTSPSTSERELRSWSWTTSSTSCPQPVS